MNPTEIRQIAEAMRDCGITHLKMHDFEISCATTATYPPADRVAAAPGATPDTPPLPAPSITEIKHKVDEIAAFLRLPDEEMALRMFPDPAPPTEFTEEG